MITLKITNTKDTSIIDGSDGLSLGEALKIASNDRENDYIIELPGGSTYEVTLTEKLSFENNITLRGVGNGFSTIKIDGSFPSSVGSLFSFSQYTLGSGSSISVNNNPNVFLDGLENLRDFDGNDLGSAESWEYSGMVDIQGDGDIEVVLTNSAIGRWATVGINTQFGDNFNFGIDYSNYGEGGDTRIVGIYTDPLIATGEVEAGSPFDSQQRFQNDLFNDNLRLLAADDYDKDGLQETYFRLGDGTAVLHAYMHADGNIQYANYQSKLDLEQFMTENGVANSIWEDWL